MQSLTVSNNPQKDVFMTSEILKTCQLKSGFEPSSQPENVNLTTEQTTHLIKSDFFKVMFMTKTHKRQAQTVWIMFIMQVDYEGIGVGRAVDSESTYGNIVSNDPGARECDFE